MYGWIKRAGEAVLREIAAEEIDRLRKDQDFVVYFGTRPNKIKVF